MKRLLPPFDLISDARRKAGDIALTYAILAAQETNERRRELYMKACADWRAIARGLKAVGR